MAVNQYFTGLGDPELQMFEDLAVEAIQIAGFDVEYIPRELNSIDDIMNEVEHSSFEKSFTIEMAPEGADDYSASSFLMEKLGAVLDSSDLTLFVAKSRFRQEVPDDALSLPGEPNEGDLVFIPRVNVLVEIKKVVSESPFATGGSTAVFELKCEAFKSSNEPMSRDPDFMRDMIGGVEELLGSADADETVTEPEGFGDNDEFGVAEESVIATPRR